MHKFAFTLVLLAATPALADEPGVPPPTRTFGIDAAGVLPLGDYARGLQFGAGALARLEFPVGTGYITGRAGLIFHVVKEGGAEITFVPIYAGYRLPLAPNGFYVAGEIGITFGRGTANTAFGSVSASDSELGVTLGAGVKSGRLDLRGSLFLPDVDNLVGIMGTIGYDFAAF